MSTLGKPWAQPDAHAPLGSVRPKPVAHGPSWKMHLFGACPLRISSGAQVKATPGAAAYGACTTANIQGPCGGMAWLTCMRCDAKPAGLRAPGRSICGTDRGDDLGPFTAGPMSPRRGIRLRCGCTESPRPSPYAVRRTGHAMDTSVERTAALRLTVIHGW